MRIRRALQTLARSVYRLRRRLERTAVGETISIFTNDAKPLRLLDSWRLARLLHTNRAKTGLVRIRPRALQNAEILLRRGTSDASVAMQTFVYGFPGPPSTPESAEVVWDLGSN